MLSVCPAADPTWCTQREQEGLGCPCSPHVCGWRTPSEATGLWTDPAHRMTASRQSGGVTHVTVKRLCLLQGV